MSNFYSFCYSPDKFVRDALAEALEESDNDAVVTVAQDDAKTLNSLKKSLAEHKEEGCVAIEHGHPERCPYVQEMEKAEKENDKEEDAMSSAHSPKAKLHSKENDGVRSYTTQAVKKDGKWVEQKTDAKGKSTRNDHDSFGKKGKHEKWLHFPPPAVEKKDTPTLDTFKGVPKEEGVTISAIPQERLYLRGGKIPYGEDGKGKPGEGQPQYAWEKGGEALSAADAHRLEKALTEGGYTGCLFEGNTNVAVRPDLCNESGQVATWRNNKGKSAAAYGEEFRTKRTIEKYNRVEKLYSVYDQIKEKILEGVQEDDPNAWLAYFLMRTKVRIGTTSNPEEGRGATDLTKGDISLSNDGETFYLAFNSKGKQFWHTTAKDTPLYEYLQRRKREISESGANKKPIFDIGITKFREYLKRISTPLTGDNDIYLQPHDFRRLGATRVAEEYLKEELKGVDSKQNRNKWEDRICKAVQEAAGHINDTPKVAFEHYILGTILMSSSPEDMAKYYPFLSRKDV